MTDYLAKPCAAFEGSRLLCAGPLIEVVLVAKDAMDRNPHFPSKALISLS